MLGIREPEIYGNTNYLSLESDIKNYCKEKNIEVEVFQSNSEGALVDRIQWAYFNDVDGIIINPGAYTHTSVAILDALKAVEIPFIEVHISDINKREDFRKISYIRDYAKKSIVGHGLKGYFEAIDEFS